MAVKITSERKRNRDREGQIERENFLAQWFCFVQWLLESPQRERERVRDREPAAVTTE